MKVAHLTSVHKPFDVRIFHKEAVSLAAAGHEVVIVAPHDQDETRQGVRIRAVPRPKNRVERARRTIPQVLAAALAEDAAVYHFHDAELIPVGLALKARGKRVVYDVHEDLPATIREKGYLPGWSKAAIALGAHAAESVAAAVFDAIVTVTPAIAARFPAAKTVLVQNFPLPHELGTADATPYPDRPQVVLYAGGIHPQRGTREMLEAMAQVPAERGARLALLGPIQVPGHEAESRAHPGWALVDHPGNVDRPELARRMGEARLGLVLFHPLPNHVNAQPNKLFEYMSAGLPLVASDFPLWRDVIGTVGCGLLVDPLDPAAIAGAIDHLLAHPEEAQAMGERGRAAVQGRYNWPSEAEALLALYDRLAPRAKEATT